MIPFAMHASYRSRVNRIGPLSSIPTFQSHAGAPAIRLEDQFHSQCLAQVAKHGDVYPGRLNYTHSLPVQAPVRIYHPTVCVYSALVSDNGKERLYPNIRINTATV